MLINYRESNDGQNFFSFDNGVVPVGRCQHPVGLFTTLMFTAYCNNVLLLSR